MKKNIRLEGLDCAVCAGKMEDAINKLEGVDSCRISYMTQRMILDVAEESFDSVMAASEKIIHDLEPEVIINVK